MNIWITFFVCAGDMIVCKFIIKFVVFHSITNNKKVAQPLEKIHISF